MRRTLLALLVLLLVGALALALTRSSPPTGPVYTVAQVVAGMAQHPRAWYGHTVTVRAVAVLVEWANEQGGAYIGAGQAGCTEAAHCALRVPTNTWLSVFLVGQVPRGRAAYARLRTSLAAARATEPPTQNASPPTLVVLGLPQRIRLMNALWHVVPGAVVTALMQVPVIGYTLAPAASVQGGSPRLYRLHLWPGRMAAGACSPTCPDGELQGSLY
jgi:hypothetical protein